MEAVRATVEKIRNLEVKGARNVAIAALEVLKVVAKETKAKNREAFLDELTEAKNMLFVSRPTEPLMRNAVRFVLNTVGGSERKKVADLSKIVTSGSKKFMLHKSESPKLVRSEFSTAWLSLLIATLPQ
jgi:translation initiation factor 2B subunit (eIF-2B alpha/beta/delta family)